MTPDIPDSLANIDRSEAALSRPSPVSSVAFGAEEEQVDTRRMWRVVRRRWRLMLCVLTVVLVMGALFTLTQRPVYESTALLMVATSPPSSSNSDGLALMTDLMALTKSRTVESQVQVIESSDVLNAAYEALNPKDVIRGFRRRTVPKWAVKVESRKGSDVITVTARAYAPDVAAGLANSVVTTYRKRDQEFGLQATKQARASVAVELNLVLVQLAQSQKDLSDYKRKTKLIAADSQLKSVAENLMALQMERDKARVEMESARRQSEALRRQLSAQGPEVQESQTVQINPEYQAALARLDDLNAKRATLIQEYVPESKEIRTIDGEIAAAEKRLKSVAATIVGSRVRARNPVARDYVGSVVNGEMAQAKVRSLEKVLADRTRQIDALPEQERDMAKLMQKVSVLDRTYQMLSDKYYTLLVNEKSILPNSRFVAAAQVPHWPAFPNRKRNAVLIFLLASVAAAAAAIVAERLDTRVRDEAVVVRLTGQPPLSVIPNLPDGKKRGLQISKIDPDTAFVESFRILRNSICLNDSSRTLKLIAVTSPGRAEGKSTTALNLATAMALDGKKVLAVDCDLRRPSLRKSMDISYDGGFTSVIRGDVSLESAIKPTRVKGLFCLPSGPFPTNPAEFLNSQESRTLFQRVAREFDYVILDCPPCAGLSDMQVLATIAEGVLLVVSVDRTSQEELRDTLRKLAQVRAPLVGSVINRLDVKGSSYEYYCHQDDTQEDQRTAPRSLLSRLQHREE